MTTDPIQWLISTPALLISMGLWVVVAFILEQIAIRRLHIPYDTTEVKRSVQVFGIVGITQIVLSLMIVPVLGIVYPYRLTTLSMDTWYHWVGAWLFVDFIYYWIHRTLHSTRLGWIAHSPHHSIEQLTVLDSLRISWAEQPVGVLAYGVPLVLAGVPPYMAGIFYIFIALYQFVVHTDVDWSLGPLSRIIYTPSAHRVHHSDDRDECDSNYGGFLTLWDQLFGTWVPTQPADKPARYGLPSGDRPDNFKDILLVELRRFVSEIANVKGVVARIKFAITPPSR